MVLFVVFVCMSFQIGDGSFELFPLPLEVDSVMFGMVVFVVVVGDDDGEVDGPGGVRIFHLDK